MTKRVFYLALAGLTATAILTVVSHYVSPLPPVFLVAIRWITLAVFVAYACFRRTLTAWIVVAMLIGATLGHDWPSLAVNLRVIAQIFLRLIKTIIAPLLFATLVSGIAAHSDLKKVGRMGVKALVYFEVVTTLALVIGLAGILSSWLSEKIDLVWNKLSLLSGRISNTLLLTLIFFLVLTPVGLFRRLLGKGGMMRVREGQESNFTDREHSFIKEDLENVW